MVADVLGGNEYASSRPLDVVGLGDEQPALLIAGSGEAFGLGDEPEVGDLLRDVGRQSDGFGGFLGIEEGHASGVGDRLLKPCAIRCVAPQPRHRDRCEGRRSEREASERRRGHCGGWRSG